MVSARHVRDMKRCARWVGETVRRRGPRWSASCRAGRGGSARSRCIQATAATVPRGPASGGEYRAGRQERTGSTVPYAELHAHSAFSFLDGASPPPEELVEEAVRLGLEAIALTDHDGFYGVVRFAEAAKELNMRTVFGSELTLDDAHLLVLARGQEGYRRLSREIAAAHLAGGEKGKLRYDLDRLTDAAGGALGRS